MAAHIQEYDWTRTRLGAPGEWSQSLKTLISLMLTSTQPMFMAWGPERTWFYNDAFMPILGRKHPWALGKPIHEVWHEALDDLKPLFDRVFAGNPVHMDDIRLMLDRQGRLEEAHFAFSYTPARDESGTVAGLFGVCTETTQQVLADRRQAATIERQRRLFTQAPGFIAILHGPDHVFEFVNEAYLRLVGQREVIGKTVRNALPDLQGQGFFDLLDRVYTTGERYIASHVPVRFGVSAEGTPVEHFLDFIYEPILDEVGKITGIFVEGHDVTEAHYAQEAVRANAHRQSLLIELGDRFRDLYDPGELAFAAAEILGRALGVSRAGYGTIDPRAETITIERDWNAPGIKSLAGVLHFRDYGSYIEDLKRGETVIVADADKDPRTAATAEALKAISAQAFVNMPVTERAGFVALLYLTHASARHWAAEELAFIREVAERTRTAVERRRAERELHDLAASLEQQVAERTAALTASEVRLRTIFETSYQYQGLIDLEGTLLQANATSLSGINANADDVVGKPFWDTPWFNATPGMLKAVREGISAVAKGETIRHEILVNLPTGWRSFDFTMRPLRDEQGEIVAIVPEAVDITERRQAEETLRQSQKLEAMGQLTGGVAHDFNNLLTPIIGSLDMLQQRGIGGEREQRLIEGALQSADRAKTLVQRLLAFARRQPLRPTSLNVASLIASMADLVASTTGPQIKVVVEIADDLPAARADANQLEMAILNLAVNARDAMADGGTLRISAAAEIIGPGHRAKLTPGPYVRLSVADTGAGMDEATLARAIEPFYSTKGVGKGTGLGLSMVHGLVSQLGGALILSSKPGIGTNVELLLPVAAEAAETSERVVPTAPEPSEKGTVLLVEDEVLVRMSTADMLTELGYKVIEASSAEEALTLFERGLHIDVLVTDHLMSGMTGGELAHVVHERWPRTQVVVVSGYAETDRIPPHLPRLTKPFRQADLAAIIAQLTGGDGQST
jgi:PAS domain S-box-containing protein